MKFQWYIVDLDEGTVVGTNDVDKARPFIENDQYLVLTAQHGMYFCGSTVENEVRDLEDALEDDPETDDDEDGDDDEEGDEDGDDDEEDGDDDGRSW